MILIIDAGTTSIRGILYDKEGNAAFISQHHSSPQFLPDGRVEQNPLIWKQLLETALKEAVEHLDQHHLSLEAIGLTAFRSPVFPIDKNGTPLLPAIMWQDKRTDCLLERFSSHNLDIYMRSGLPVSSVFSAIKMYWIKQYKPEEYQQSWKLIGIYEYLLFLLTGRMVTDHSVASRTNLFNLQAKDWDDKLISYFGIDKAKLAELVPPGSVCGELCKKMRKELSISGSIPVVAAGGDQQCSVLGFGITTPGTITVNTGTGAYVLTISPEPVRNEACSIYSNVAAAGDYLIESSLSTAGTVYRWFAEVSTKTTTTEKNNFSLLDSEIAQSPPGANGVMLIPRFKGPADPAGQTFSKGAFLNLDLSTKRGDMARAILEGISFELHERIIEIESQTNTHNRIFASGGMTRFPLYNQILADIFQRPVTSMKNGEATAFGAWLNTNRAFTESQTGVEFSNNMKEAEADTYLPHRKHSALYRSILERRKQTMKALGYS